MYISKRKRHVKWKQHGLLYFSVTIISQIWKVDRMKCTRVFATVMSDMQWLHEVLAQSFFF